jgi:hypothetical protein
MGWASRRSSVNEIEIDVPENHEVLKIPFNFKYDSGKLIRNTDLALSESKKRKEMELDIECQNAILNGFDHSINGVLYHFSFDTEAQLNFQGSDRILDKGLVPSIGWSVKRGGVTERIEITKDIMSQLVIVILKHKDYNIRKFRELLLPKLALAQSVPEVNAINWNMKL